MGTSDVLSRTSSHSDTSKVKFKNSCSILSFKSVKLTKAFYDLFIVLHSKIKVNW